MKNTNHLNYQFIDTASGLEDIARTFEREKTVAVDLEADSMYHYQERVCLIQMATKKVNIIIDTIQVKDLFLLKPFFAKGNIKKIFHGADYDVRSLFRDFNIEINNLFDTHIACMFLGEKETGLNQVIQKRFNVKLKKKYQKKDWSKRPLPAEMIDYAINDVIYLTPLATILEKDLETKLLQSCLH